MEPLMTAMQSPRRIASAPSATLWVPVAQADTMHTLWPIAPVSMAIIPDVESTRPLAMNVGGTARGPRSWRTRHASIMSCWPPAPEPNTTPTSSRFESSIVKPESSTACLAAATPYWRLISVRRTALASSHRAGRSP